MSRPLAYYGIAAAFAALIGVTAPANAETSFWQTRNFPSPNGGMLVYRMVEGQNQLRFNEDQPLMCSADHRAKSGITGYESPSTLVQSGQADQVRR